jgi:hypothetical protein
MPHPKGEIAAMCWNCDKGMVDGFRVTPWRSSTLKDGLLICTECYISVYLPLVVREQIGHVGSDEGWSAPAGMD